MTLINQSGISEMKTILFASDLDNTLLYSWKKYKLDDICIEEKDGKRQGFVSQFVYTSLEKVNQVTCFVPITSRSVNQYHRIHWNHNQLPEYAIVANGGILIAHGNIDLEWLQETKKMVQPFENSMKSLYKHFDETKKYKICRIVDDMYFYIHCYEKNQAIECEEQYAGSNEFTVVLQGEKVYFFPPVINKGIAVERLRKRIVSDKIIAAGDSVIDIPMLQKADFAIIPKDMEWAETNSLNTLNRCGEERFADYVCRRVLEISRDINEKVSTYV